MSFHIDFRLDPEQPRRGEKMSLYVTLIEDTRCDGYGAHSKFTHPSGQVYEDSRHCIGLDPP